MHCISPSVEAALVEVLEALIVVAVPQRDAGRKEEDKKEVGRKEQDKKEVGRKEQDKKEVGRKEQDKKKVGRKEQDKKKDKLALHFPLPSRTSLN